MANLPKRPRDPNQLAKLMVNIAVGDETDNSESTEPKGVPGAAARAAALEPGRRSEIARKAAKSRWANRPNQD